MNTLEIICESCESRMRLSTALLSKIEGKTGRVTCKQCQNKVVLDARNSEVVVKEGGYAADSALELEQISELPPTADPHLSEFPAEPESTRERGEVSLPPPLPEELKLRRSLRAAQQPNLEELAAAVTFARDDEEFEAPEPGPMRAEEDSLSPHSISDSEDDESMIELGREFNSSPFASPRDESFNSLYPSAVTREKAEAPAPSPYVSKAPPAPKAGELHRARSGDDLFEEAPVSVRDATVELAEDGSLINKVDKGEVKAKDDEKRGGAWVPWALAAVALLAFGVSVTMQKETKVIVQAPAKVAPAAKASAAAPQAAVEAEAAVEETSVEEEAEKTEEPVAAAPAPVAKVAKTPTAQPKSEDAEEASSDAASSDAASSDAASEAAAAEEPEAADEPAEEPEEAKPDLPPFSSSAASGAMRESTALASACRRPGDPSGYAKVIVTFAPSGRVTRASVNGPPFAGTQTGGCIASRFRSARVPAFSGEHVTVTKTVAIR